MNAAKEITRLEHSSVKLTVTVNKEDVANSYRTFVSKLAKNIQIPGFRKGHVPVSVLERKYGKALKTDAASEIIEQTLSGIFEDDKENRPLPYSQPTIEEAVEIKEGEDLRFSVIYDVFPEVSIGDLKSITVREPEVAVKDEDIQRELEEIRERNALVLDKADGEAAASDDIVTINYNVLDEQDTPLAGESREGITFTLGKEQNVFKIDSGIAGMKKGETKIITTSYPVDFEDTQRAGKPVRLSVSLTALKTRNVPALDDELAQDVNEKYKTLGDMRNDIKKNMELARDNRVRELKINSLLEQIIEKNPIELPRSMLEAELESRWRMAAQRMQTTVEQMERLFNSSGHTKEDMLKDWTPTAEKALKSRLAVDALMKKHDITVTPEEITEEYKRIASRAGISEEEVQKHYADPRAKEYLIDDVKEQKLYSTLFDQVRVVKGDTLSFEELFKTAR